LGAKKVYRLGFRVAALAGLESARRFDRRKLQWNAQPMFEYA
jgi:hypothetical protein